MLRRSLSVLVAAVLVVAPGLPSRTASADDIRDRQQPMITTLDLSTAWRTTRGRGVTVGVVDTGVDAGNRDFKGAVTTGPNFLQTIDGKSAPKRLHGTAMASLIAGRGHGAGNRDGVVGVAPEARVIAVRALGEKEDASFGAYQDDLELESAAISNGIRYVVDHGADVINLSLGSYGRGGDIRRAVAYAIAHNVVVVAAVGNDGDSHRKVDENGFAPYSYPAAYPGVIGVAATDPDHERAYFSNRNYSALVAAPGANLPAGLPGNGYELVSGTSPATALVSGTAALIRARYRKLAPPLVAQALLSGTAHRPGSGYDADVGYGEINAARALEAAGRLAGYTSTSRTGVAAGGRFVTKKPGPVQVIPRPAWFTGGVFTVGLVSLAGLFGAMLTGGLLFRRVARRDPGPPPPGAPPGALS
ncbi:S8 family peptidase [Actinomadura scrupuli]|uniref:S8 family peptidase n=1 Tax=Actinomadura scrupuli TaxID=559629 RepID=UPI003D9822F7